MTSLTNLRLAGPVLLGAYLLGIVVAVAAGLDSLGTALTAGTYLNAPGPIIVVQALAIALTLRGSRPASVLLLASTSVSVAACLFDGDVGHAGMTTAEQLVQAGLVAAIFWTWLCAVAAAGRVWRRAPAAA